MGHAPVSSRQQASLSPSAPSASAAMRVASTICLVSRPWVNVKLIIVVHVLGSLFFFFFLWLVCVALMSNFIINMLGTALFWVTGSGWWSRCLDLFMQSEVMATHAHLPDGVKLKSQYSQW